MEFIYEYGLFLAQAVTLVAAILIVIAGLVSMGHRQKAEQHEGHIEIRNLNEKYRLIGDSIQHMVTDHDALKAEKKVEKKAEKAKAKAAKKKRKKSDGETADDLRKRLYILAFDGPNIESGYSVQALLQRNFSNQMERELDQLL